MLGSFRKTQIPRLAGGLAIFCGMGVLVGWQFDNTLLKSVFPGFTAMNPMSAVAFILTGTALCLKGPRHRSDWVNRIANLLSGGGAAIGLIKLLDFFVGGLGVDQILFTEKLANGFSVPNRLAPNAAVNFLVLGVALFLIDYRAEERRSPVPWAFVFLGLSACFAILGYAYGVIALYQVSRYIPMALHTAIVFLILAIGGLSARPRSGVMRLVTSNEIGGETLRLLLPSVVLLPPSLGLAIIALRKSELISPDQGFALFVLSSVLLTSAVVVKACVSLTRAELARQSAEVALEAQRAQVVFSAKMAALGEMAGGVAHEINNPLAIILGKAIRVRKRLTPEQKVSTDIDEEMARIENIVSRISRITSGLLAFSRHEPQGDFPPSPINHLIEETLTFCMERFTRAGVVVRNKAQTESTLVDVNPTELGQVFLNLLNNAFFAVENVSEKWIEIRVNSLADAVEIIFEDSGLGVSSEFQEKIFQPFFTTRPIGSGTGLGLSISRGIVQKHGGVLLLDPSAPYTRFVVRLPKSAGAGLEKRAA